MLVSGLAGVVLCWFLSSLALVPQHHQDGSECGRSADAHRGRNNYYSHPQLGLIAPSGSRLNNTAETPPTPLSRSFSVVSFIHSAPLMPQIRSFFSQPVMSHGRDHLSTHDPLFSRLSVPPPKQKLPACCLTK